MIAGIAIVKTIVVLLQPAAGEVGADRLGPIGDACAPKQLGQTKSISHTAKNEFNELNKSHVTDHSFAYSVELPAGNG